MILPSALSLARDNLSFSLEECLTALDNGQERDPYLIAQIAERYHLLGIAVLLQDANPSGFASLLALSGQADCYLRALDLSNAPKQLIASRGRPFADALSAGALDLAREIANLAPNHHLEGWEYEDDFLQFHFQHRLVLGQDAAGSLGRVLERWQEVLDGAASPALDASRALLERDADLFHTAFTGMMHEREKQFELWRKSTAHNAEVDATEGQISVGGLAMIRLAELRGLGVEKEYPFVPSLARVPLGTPLPPQGTWRRLDEALAFA